MEKAIFVVTSRGIRKRRVCPKCTIACWRSYSVVFLWQSKLLENLEEYFFQHGDLKLTTKSCVGSVPCVSLLFLEVFGPEKKNRQVN